MVRLQHVGVGDISTELTARIAQVAATLIEANMTSFFPEAAEMALELFDAVQDQIVARTNLEIDAVNARIERELGSVAKGGDS